MSKELDALNDLRNSGLVKDDVVCFTKKAFEKRLDIIETRLKREDSIEITAIDIEQDNKALCKENKKLKRELEIIIKKEVEIGLLKGILHADKSLHTASYYNSHFVATYRHLTQEEFDSLKKVLI